MAHKRLFLCLLFRDSIMNDFFIANNRSISTAFLDASVDVRQVQMKDFDLWLSHAEPVKAFLKDKDYSDEILTALFKDHTIAVLTICNMVTDLDSEKLLSQAKESEVKFLNILKAVLTVNQAYFKPQPEKPKMGQKKEVVSDSTWFDSFQFLVSAGHQHQDIMNMTYGAYERYLKAATKDYRSKLQYLTVAIRSAQHADANDFKKFMDELKP